MGAKVVKIYDICKKNRPERRFFWLFLFPTNYVVVPLISLIFTDFFKQKLFKINPKIIRIVFYPKIVVYCNKLIKIELLLAKRENYGESLEGSEELFLQFCYLCFGELQALLLFLYQVHHTA